MVRTGILVSFHQFAFCLNSTRKKHTKTEHINTAVNALSAYKGAKHDDGGPVLMRGVKSRIKSPASTCATQKKRALTRVCFGL